VIKIPGEKIIVYGAPSCPWCLKLKDWLESKKASFEYIDISLPKNKDKVQEMVQKSGQMGIPVTIIGDKAIVGFDKEKISKLAGI
jgi:glutaredoxin 3